MTTRVSPGELVAAAPLADRAPIATTCVSRGLLLAAACVALALAFAPPIARGDAGATLGDSSRAGALAGAMTARGGDLAAISANPAGLGELARPELALYGHAGQLRLHFAREGEAGARSRQLVAGYGVSLGVRLPGPEWLQRVRVGVSLHLPVEHVIRVRAPSRPDAPQAALYGARVERTALTASLGIALPAGVSIGLGVALTPALFAPTRVFFDASRGDDPDDGVVVEIEREVGLEAALLGGILLRPVPELALGVSYHQAIRTRAEGPNDLRAGAVLADDPLAFTLFYEPERWSIGVSLAPSDELSVSIDAIWCAWSAYRTAHDEAPDPRWRDVLWARAGLEWRPRAFFAVRLGYAFEPTPVPAQVGPTTLIDGDRHVLAAGLGVDLEPLARWPLRIDLHGRVHVVDPMSARKDPARLTDRDPALRGRQIDDLGYPAFDARLGVLQLGLTITVALGPLPQGVRR